MTTSGRALSMASMSRPAAAMRSRVSFTAMTLVAAGATRRASIDDAQDVDRFLDVGVAQEERLDDLFLVLAALGWRVGNHGDRARAGDAIEIARGVRHRLQRALRASGCARSMETSWSRNCGSNTRADVGDLRQRGVDHARRCIGEDERRRQGHVGRQFLAERRQAARTRDQRLELGLAFAGGDDLVAQLCPGRCQERLRPPGCRG